MRKILLIEDEAQHMLLAKIRLETKGYEICAARTGADGIKAAAAHMPDIILLDLLLPDMEPGSVIKGLRAHPSLRRTPIIAFTALDAAEIQRRHLGGEVAGFVQKPYETQELLEKIEALLSTAPE